MSYRNQAAVVTWCNCSDSPPDVDGLRHSLIKA